MLPGKSEGDPLTDKIQLMRTLKEILSLTLTTRFVKNSEDVIFFMGMSRAGKSTLLNSLIGNNLIGEMASKFRSICIKKADDAPGPKIGDGPASETLVPTRWISQEKLGGAVTCDCPGSEENRGPIVDIVAASYVRGLFSNVKSAKLVLVVDVNDILNDRVDSFRSLLTSLNNSFKGKLTDCFSGIAVVFTKVPFYINNEPVTKDFIIQVLRKKLLSSTSLKLTKTTRKFIEHLTNNQKQIGLFRKAEIGPIPGDADADVVQAIKSIVGITQEILKSTAPNISDATKLFLYEIRHELTSYDMFIEIQATIEAVFKDILINYTNAVKCDSMQEKIASMKKEVIQLSNAIQEIINNTSFLSKIEDLKKLSPKFEKKINVNNLIENWQIMEFIDGMLGLKESNLFNLNLRSIMEKVKLDISVIVISLELQLKEIDKGEADDKLNKAKSFAKVNEKREQKEREHLKDENKKSSVGFFEKIGRFMTNNRDLLINLGCLVKQAFDILQNMRATRN